MTKQDRYNLIAAICQRITEEKAEQEQQEKELNFDE